MLNKYVNICNSFEKKTKFVFYMLHLYNKDKLTTF